ncbi:MAG: copper homeostasis protein CutC [Bacteroidetes bacterium]|nr:MAG: copper homeostasis protein CutC [Bacteroidota bacterium]
MPLKEACVESLQEALAAERQGADRLELCSRLEVGGLTPGVELAQEVLNAVSIPVMLMIRCREGDFCYSPAEVDEMLRQIATFKALNSPQLAGFVTGALTEVGTVDVPTLSRLADAAQPSPITFHKAIDECPDPLAAIQVLKTLPGITRVLSSGGASTAQGGAEMLMSMIAAAGENLTIIAAGKVTHENLAALHHSIGASEYHGRLIVGNLKPR